MRIWESKWVNAIYFLFIHAHLSPTGKLFGISTQFYHSGVGVLYVNGLRNVITLRGFLMYLCLSACIIASCDFLVSYSCWYISIRGIPQDSHHFGVSR